MARANARPGDVSLKDIPDDIFQAYERMMVPAVFAPWSARLLADAALRRGERVLDVGCGTGAVAREAARRVGVGGWVTGLDVLPGMLAVARDATHDVYPPIRWVEGDAMDMPLPDASFDVVLSQQALQFVPDKIAALTEAHRVLARGGRVLVSVWGPIERSPAVAALQHALEHHVPQVAGFFPAVFSLSDQEELRDLLVRSGFREVGVRALSATVRFPSVEAYLQTYLAATPIGALIASLSADQRAAFGREIATSLRDFIDDQGLAVTQETNVGSGRV
ncbi:MAG TPA: methyltransferase domain-containing protein [Actinomycetota bacterium]|nr:methyltransferase domain-containing protein [Actinomycetota bacterium]